MCLTEVHVWCLMSSVVREDVWVLVNTCHRGSLHWCSVVKQGEVKLEGIEQCVCVCVTIV